MLTLLFGPENGSEDTSPSINKVQPLPDHNAFLIRSIQGLRMQITRRLDERGGYDVTKIGHHRIPSSSVVLVSDPAVMLALRPDYVLKGAGQGIVDASAIVNLNFMTSETSLTARGAKAGFGPAVDTAPPDLFPMALFDITATDNAQACSTIKAPRDQLGNYALIAKRGSCTFVNKMRNAAQAGAAAIIVLSEEEDVLVPSADPVELVGIPKPIPLVLLPRSEGNKLLSALATSNGMAMLDSVQLSSGGTAQSVIDDLADTPVVVNGHHLVNCRLVRP